MMDRFEQMKECLLAFEYPSIHILDDSEIADIFHLSNRKFLLTWLLKNINKEFELTAEEDLGNILCDHGFCLESEKNGLINGELDISRAVQILHTIFMFMKNNNVPVKTKELNLSNGDLADIISLDLNLFPDYGPLKTFSEEEKLRKIEQMTEELNSLKTEETEVKEKEDCRDIKPDVKELSELIQKTKRILPQLKILTDPILKYHKPETQTIKFGQKDGEVVKKLNQRITIVLEYMQGLDTINKFKVTDELFQFKKEIVPYSSDCIEGKNTDMFDILKLLTLDDLNVSELPFL